MALIDPGEAAPDFKLHDQQGKKHRLKDYRGRTVVLYFYPEDDTPLCTAQACQFRDHHSDFAHLKAAVLGVSPDSVGSHRAFVEKHALAFTLLSDARDDSGKPPVCTAYGAWGEKNMYGKVVVSMLRTTYIIGPDGKVLKRWDRVKTPGHAAAVLEAVRLLHTGEKLTVFGNPKPLKRRKTPARQKTRTQGGHQGYSGVRATKGKKTARGTVAARANASLARVRGKR